MDTWARATPEDREALFNQTAVTKGISPESKHPRGLRALQDVNLKDGSDTATPGCVAGHRQECRCRQPGSSKSV